MPFSVGKIKYVISNEFHSFIVHIKKNRLNDFVYVQKMSCCSKINTCIQTHWRSFNQKNMKKRIQNDVNYECGKKLWALLVPLGKFDKFDRRILHSCSEEEKKWCTPNEPKSNNNRPQNASYTSHERSIDRLLNSLWNDKPETYKQLDTCLRDGHIWRIGVSYKLDEIEYAAPQKNAYANTVTPVIEQFNYIFIEITSVGTRESRHCTLHNVPRAARVYLEEKEQCKSFHQNQINLGK